MGLASLPACNPQWLQQPVSIQHDLAVWLSFDAQVRRDATRSHGSVPGPGQASANPMIMTIMTIMTIMKIFSRLYLPQPRQPKPASRAFSKHGKGLMDDKTIDEQICQPDCCKMQTSSMSACLDYAAHQSVSPVQSGPGQPGRGQSAHKISVSLGLGKSFLAAALGRLAPRLQLPGPHHRMGVGSKSAWSTQIFNNTSLHAHVLLVPRPGYSGCYQSQPRAFAICRCPFGCGC